MKQRTFLKCIFLVTGLLLATFQAAAQAPGGGGGRGGMAVLTQEQRTQLREELQADMAPTMQKLAAAQKEVAKAALANESKEAITAKLEAVNKIQTEVFFKRLAAVKNLKLTADQKSQLESARDGGYNALFGGFGGFGRGGGGRRGGNNNN